MHYRLKALIYIFFAGFSLFVTSCNNSRFLAEDEYLLKQNVINLDKSEGVDNARALKYELISVTKQKPNSKFLGLFPTRLWLHNVASPKEDSSSSKVGKWLKYRIGEAPTLYNEKITNDTEESLQYYLINKGYRNADVETEVKLKRKKAIVKYNIKPKKVYRIDSVSFVADDLNMKTLLKYGERKSLLQKGTPLDQKLFNKEKNRIATLMREQGYYYFYPNYVFFQGDSSNHEVDVIVNILPPTDSTKHERYTVNNVFIYPSHFPGSSNYTNADTIIQEGYHFINEGELFVKKRPLISSVFFKKGKVYSQKDYNLTTNRLGDLGIYKFVSIKLVPSADPYLENMLDCHVYMTPSKKMEFGWDFEVNTDNASSLGTGVNLSYKNRNLFKGAELLAINIENGLEFYLKNDRLFNTVDAHADAKIYFPKFVVPFRSNVKNKRTTAQTKLYLGYDYLLRFEYYSYNLFSSSFGYEWQRKKSRRHFLNPISLNYFGPVQRKEKFITLADENPFLDKSFQNQFIIGSNYSYIYNGPIRRGGSSWFFSTNLDFAGNTTYLANKIIRPQEPFKLFGVDYSQYAKIDADARYYRVLNRKTSFASKLAIGLAKPYGNSNVVPYAKQFYVGGANGLRAWRVRELGPGAFKDQLLYPEIPLLRQDIVPYQAGDIKLEASAELRFDLFSALEGALFVDAGNIWLLQNEVDRPGGQFSTSFLKEIALGAGWGLRVDFSYFIVRFDVAYQLRYPFEYNYGKQSVYHNQNPFSLINLWRDARPNLAVGYPF